MWSNRNSLSLLVGMQSGPTTLGNSLEVKCKVTQTFIMWPSNPHPWVFTKRNEHWHPCKNLYANVYTSIIHNGPKLGTAPIPSHRWMHRQTLIPHAVGSLLSDENEPPIHAITWANLKFTRLSERNQIRVALYNMIPFIQCVGRDKTTVGTAKLLSGFQGLGLGAGFKYKGHTGELWGWWNCSVS